MDIKFDNIKFETESDFDGKTRKTLKKGGKEKSPDVVWCKDFNLGKCIFKPTIKGNVMVNM